jgi:hypothetical protein
LDSDTEIVDLGISSDELDEKKEREVKEDANAEVLYVRDPDLCIDKVDKDFICSICFLLLSKPKSKYFFSFVPSLFTLFFC